MNDQSFALRKLHTYLKQIEKLAEPIASALAIRGKNQSKPYQIKEPFHGADPIPISGQIHFVTRTCGWRHP